MELFHIIFLVSFQLISNFHNPNITDDYDDIICGKVSKGLKVEKVCKKSVFRVIRRNIRKERRHWKNISLLIIKI